MKTNLWQCASFAVLILAAGCKKNSNSTPGGGTSADTKLVTNSTVTTYGTFNMQNVASGKYCEVSGVTNRVPSCLMVPVCSNTRNRYPMARPTAGRSGNSPNNQMVTIPS